MSIISPLHPTEVPAIVDDLEARIRGESNLIATEWRLLANAAVTEKADTRRAYLKGALAGYELALGVTATLDHFGEPLDVLTAAQAWPSSRCVAWAGYRPTWCADEKTAMASGIRWGYKNATRFDPQARECDNADCGDRILVDDGDVVSCDGLTFCDDTHHAEFHGPLACPEGQLEDDAL